jgi:hypothetical protein
MAGRASEKITQLIKNSTATVITAKKYTSRVKLWSNQKFAPLTPVKLKLSSPRFESSDEFAITNQ